MRHLLDLVLFAAFGALAVAGFVHAHRPRRQTTDVQLPPWHDDWEVPADER